MGLMRGKVFIMKEKPTFVCVVIPPPAPKYKWRQWKCTVKHVAINWGMIFPTEFCNGSYFSGSRKPKCGCAENHHWKKSIGACCSVKKMCVWFLKKKFYIFTTRNINAWVLGEERRRRGRRHTFPPSALTSAFVYHMQHCALSRVS